MLYERWRQTVRAGPAEWALTDLAGGVRLTFAELDRAAEAEPGEDGPVAFPQGNSVEFVLALLRAWRRGQIVCPLEPSAPRPVLDRLPPGAHLKLTSATGGVAKLVAFTGEQLAADAAHIVDTMGLRRDWPNLGVISLAHSYGFSNLVLPLLLHGIPLILVDAPLPQAVRAAAGQAKEVTLPAVPALWRAWQDADAIPPNVRLALSAGAPLPLGLEQEIFAARGLKVHNFYGASECGGIAYDAAEVPREDASCVGRALNGVELARGADGCLEVRSRAVGETYWPESDPALGAGCYRSGDLVELREGQVFLCGRRGDQINVAGRKVSPESIERALLAHPAVRDCVAFGVPAGNDPRAETIVACVAAGTAVTEVELRHFLLRRLPAWQVPRAWMVRETLPVDGRGKRPRAQWREEYLRESAEAGPTRDTTNEA